MSAHWLDQKDPQPITLWEKIGGALVVIALLLGLYVWIFDPELWLQLWH